MATLVPIFENYIIRVSDMTQWVKGLAARSDDLSSVPGTYAVEGEN